MAEKALKALDKTEDKSTFQQLYDIPIDHLVEKEGHLTFVSWANTWHEIKKFDPDATFDILTSKDALGNELPFFTDGKRYFVRVELTIKGSLSKDWYDLEGSDPKASEIAHAHQRALCKAAARLGFGLKLWQKEQRKTLDLKPAVETRGPGASSSEEYRVAIPKSRDHGKTLDEMGFSAVESSYSYWTARIKSEGKPAGGAVKDFIEHAKVYLDAKRQMGVVQNVQTSRGDYKILKENPPPHDDMDIPF